MGQNITRPDVQIVQDYATDEGYVRLHLDLMLDLEDLRGIRKLMDAGAVEAATARLRACTPKEASGFIDLFLTPLARPVGEGVA